MMGDACEQRRRRGGRGEPAEGGSVADDGMMGRDALRLRRGGRAGDRRVYLMKTQFYQGGLVSWWGVA